MGIVKVEVRRVKNMGEGGNGLKREGGKGKNVPAVPILA